MNEKLQEALLKWLNKLESGTDTVIDFASSEVPLYIQELLTWTIVSGFITWATLMSLIFLPWVFLAREWRRYLALEDKTKHWANTPSEGPVGLMIASVIHGIVCIFLPVGLSLDWLKAWLAPRVFLLEYAAKMTS